jgi:hypothetical protein
MKVEIEVPETLKEITVEQYQKFNKLNTDENEGSSFLMQKMIEIFCGLNLKDVASIKYSYVLDIAQHLNNVFDTKCNLIPTFTLNGVEYGFIPVLDDITLGEYVDLDTYLGDWDNMHKAMSVLYRPIKMKHNNRYIIEEYKGTTTANKMLNAPLDVALGATLFFYHLSNELLTTTLNYLTEQGVNKLTTEQQEILAKNGAGFSLSMDLLKGMLPDMIQSQDKNF